MNSETHGFILKSTRELEACAGQLDAVEEL